MTVASALKLAIINFKKANIPSASLDAEVLLSHSIHKSKEFLYAHPKNTITKRQYDVFQKLLKQRIKREPVAYITNTKEFYGYEFYVDKRILIPRGETESLVDKTIDFKSTKDLKSFPSITTTIIDVGTGSGCIIISIVKELIKQYTKRELENCTFVATETSTDALDVAKSNAIKHNVEQYIKFYQGNLLLPILNDCQVTKADMVIIIANLPYITPTLYKTLQPEITLYEPRVALLTPNNDALYYYKLLEQQVALLRKKTNANIYTIYEEPS